jgi:hypothetical protein
MLICASPLRGGATENHSGRGINAERPLCGFLPPRFFAPVKLLRSFFYWAQKNIRYNRTFYQYALSNEAVSPLSNFETASGISLEQISSSGEILICFFTSLLGKNPV